MRVASILSLLILLGPLSSVSRAQVSTITLFSYEPSDSSFELDDRLGQISTNKVEYVINHDDCVEYKQQGRGLKVTFDVSPAPTGGTWSVEVGNDCSNEPSATDECKLVEDGSRSLQTTVTRYSYTVPFEQLIDIDCDTTADKQREMLIIVTDASFTGEETAKPKLELRVRLDFTPPSAPSGVEASGGSNNINVSWSSVEGADSYRVYYSDKEFTFEERDSVDSKSASSTSVQLTGSIENGRTYYVTVAAVDENGNESAFANFVSVVPEQTQGFYEHYVKTAGEDADDGGFCFVATATFGSYDDRRVVSLRHFRDTVLATSNVGRSLIAAYYSYGPIWASAIAENRYARYVVGAVLWPIAMLIELYGASAWLFWLLVLSSAGATVYWRRRRRHILQRTLVSSEGGN
ncbi:MAG: fibronectin type III domain-containing protein [Myxococcales bacterium]|nr:fibronectin type III domain-containing protein [Myxococcales bacterium]